MTSKTDSERFVSAMRNSGICLHDWAGGVQVWATDEEVLSENLYPDSGDWIVYDTRGHTGFLGVPHDAWADIRKLELKPSAKGDFAQDLPEVARSVPTKELMNRYIWISSVFLNWLHADGGWPFSIWKTADEMQSAYLAEAEHFASDPWLATYWLLHFGLCNDPRYAEVASAVTGYKLHETHDHARWTLAFFETMKIDDDIELNPSYNPRGDDYSGLFLRRRANLLYQTYSQSYRGDGAPVANLWHSVSLYRRRDRWAIRRMRWLKNNLEKFALWDALDTELSAPENDDIPYINYARLSRPGAANADVLANQLVQELQDNPEDWKFWNKDWAKMILWDVRSSATDRAALKAAASIVFEGDFSHDQYADILTAIGETAPGGAAARTALKAFGEIFSGAKSIRLETWQNNQALLARADSFLAEQSDDTIDFVVDAAPVMPEAMVLWRFLLLHGARRPDCESLLLRLTPRAAPNDYDLKRLFGTNYPELITGVEDPTYKAMKRVLTLPVSAFDSEWSREKCLQTVAILFCPTAHTPGIFEDLLEVVRAGSPDPAVSVVFTHVFRKTWDQPVDPIMALDKAQVERLLEATADYIRRHPEASSDALRLIFYCANPQAIDWVQARLSDPDFFKLYEGHRGNYDPMPKEMRLSLEAALDWHKDDNT